MDDTVVKITNENIFNAMQQHFNDDAVAFQKIDDGFKKSAGIAVNNGEHMSAIRVELTGVNIRIKELFERVEKHIVAVEPILTSYQDSQTVKRYMSNIIKPVSLIVVGGASLISAWYIIKQFIKTLWN